MTDLRRRALRRLGVFRMDDRVIYTPDSDVDDEEYATVIEIDGDRIKIRFDEIVWSGPKENSAVTRWTLARNLRHRHD